MSNIKNIDYPIEELIPIVAELASKYTGCEHSSITYEKAQMLMEGVLYCINEWNTCQTHELLKNNCSAKEAYQYGHAAVTDKSRQLYNLYHTLAADFLDYGLKCLRNTITKEIPLFLSNYDPVYAPQETLFIPDYPLLKNLTSLSGIDFMSEYTACIYLEQQFLKNFDTEYIIGLLQTYHSEYEELVENICDMILPNTIGHILLDKPFSSRGFRREELEALEHILLTESPQELAAHITRILKLLTKDCDNSASELFSYLTCIVPALSARIQTSLQTHCFDTLFLGLV